VYSRSPKNPTLQLSQESAISASTTPHRPIWNTFGTVAVRDFWENGCSPSTTEGPLGSISMTSVQPSATLSSHPLDSGAQVDRPRVGLRGATQPTSAPVVKHKDRHRYGICGGLPRRHQEETNGPRQALHGRPRNAPSLLNVVCAPPLDCSPVVGPSLHRHCWRAPDVSPQYRQWSTDPWHVTIMYGPPSVQLT